MIGHLTKKKKPGTENEYYPNWYIVIDDPKSTTGRKQKWISTQTSNKKLAQKMQAKIVNDANEGKLVTQKDTNLEDFVELFKKHHVKNNLKINSEKQYDWAFKQIPLSLNKVLITKLTPIQISSFLLELGCSGTSKRIIFNAIKTCLNKAVLWGYLNNNPCNQITPPKKSTKPKQILGKEELKNLLSIAKDTPNFIPLLLASTCGLRRGELCGLRWRDVDLEACVMRPRFSLDVIDGEVIIEEVKTDTSTRPIRFPVSLSHELKSHKEKWSVILKRPILDDDFVLIGLDGKSRNPDSVYRGLQRLIEKNGISPTSLHGLRHSHATLMLLADVPVKVVSERLGHSTTKITQDIYMHVLPDMQDKAADAVDTIFDIANIEKKTSNETSNGVSQKPIKKGKSENGKNQKNA